MSFSFNARRGLLLVRSELFGPSGSIVLGLALDTGATSTMVNVGPLITVGYDPYLMRLSSSCNAKTLMLGPNHRRTGYSLIHPMHKPCLAWLLSLPFALSLLFAWAWFNTDIGRRMEDTSLETGDGRSTLDIQRSTSSNLQSSSSQSDSHPRLWLLARTNIPGYSFIPEPVSDAVMNTLGTTNILSGTFYRSVPYQLPTPDFHLPPERVTIFLASWSAGDNKGLTAIQHTPDICWGGSGWKALNLGQPLQIGVNIPVQQPVERAVSGEQSEVSDQRSSLTSDLRRLTSDLNQLPSPNSHLLKCDFRIFELPASHYREAAAWCALAGGQPLVGTTEWGRESISRHSVAYDFWSRSVQLKQILHAVQNRLPVREKKQFVRYSVALESDWQSGIQAMNAFGPGWLTAYRL